VRSVFMEEMLHMTLVANLLNAIGGRPAVDTPRMLPTYPTFLPHSKRAFEVSLERLSPQALETFMRIERPDEHDGLPEDNEFETIGQFYEAIEVALRRLCDELGEAALFCGDPSRQVTDELYYGGSGRIIAVTGLESALAALGEIVEQGEGLQHKEVWDGDRSMFHPERDSRRSSRLGRAPGFRPTQQRGRVLGYILATFGCLLRTSYRRAAGGLSAAARTPGMLVESR
jgi:hypothetical protein